MEKIMIINASPRAPKSNSQNMQHCLNSTVVSQRNILILQKKITRIFAA